MEISNYAHACPANRFPERAQQLFQHRGAPVFLSRSRFTLPWCFRSPNGRFSKSAFSLRRALAANCIRKKLFIITQPPWVNELIYALNWPPLRFCNALAHTCTWVFVYIHDFRKCCGSFCAVNESGRNSFAPCGLLKSPLLFLISRSEWVFSEWAQSSKRKKKCFLMPRLGIIINLNYKISTVSDCALV